MNWDAVRRAVASFGLHPLEFWGSPDDWWSGMSLDELVEYSEGVRQEREWGRKLLAWHAANVVNLGGMRKRPIKTERILGISSSTQPAAATLAEMTARMKADRAKAEAASAVHFDNVADREVGWGGDDDDAIDYGVRDLDDDEDEDEWRAALASDEGG